MCTATSARTGSKPSEVTWLMSKSKQDQILFNYENKQGETGAQAFCLNSCTAGRVCGWSAPFFKSKLTHLSETLHHSSFRFNNFIPTILCPTSGAVSPCFSLSNSKPHILTMKTKMHACLCNSYLFSWCGRIMLERLLRRVCSSGATLWWRRGGPTATSSSGKYSKIPFCHQCFLVCAFISTQITSVVN